MWSEEHKNIILEAREQNKSLEEIAALVGRTPAATRVYMYRNGIELKRKVACPIVEKLITIKFVNANWFRPNREFYELVKIPQKRFTDLRCGYANPTEDEMKKIADVLHISADEFMQLFKSRQLNLFET